MNKYIGVLTNAKRNKICGNHRVEFINDGHCLTFRSDDGTKEIDFPKTATRAFIYHWTVICLVDDVNKCFWLTHNGFNTPSTNTALNGYRAYFKLKGYTDVNKIPVFKYEQKRRK